jgi:Tfp pilus assembly major pilin PilA
MNDIAAVVIVVVGIVVVVIGSKADPYEHVSVKPVVKSTTVEAAAGKAAMKSTAVESSAREAAMKPTATAVKTTTTTAAAVATATTTTTTTTTASGRRGGRLSQPQGCQRQQRNNRFPYHGCLHLLDDVAPGGINVFAARLFEVSTVN